MAFDMGLADRVRAVLAGRPGISERRMFGGLAFLVDGKMFIGIRDTSLMARVGAERHADALALPHVRLMDFTGRPMKGYVYVDSPALVEERDLKAWVLWCADHVGRLPAKAAASSAQCDQPRF
jgi:TfoX/Sxy family transcriptional regulator of competence genes